MSGNLIGVMTAASTDAGRIEAADTGIKVVVVEDDEVERCCHELGRLAVINEFVYNSGRFSYVETKTAFPRLPTNCRLFLDVCGSVQRLHRETKLQVLREFRRYARVLADGEPRLERWMGLVFHRGARQWGSKTSPCWVYGYENQSMLPLSLYAAANTSQ